MSDDLISRVTKALAAHAWMPGLAACYCGATISWRKHPRHQAVAVIAELGETHAIVELTPPEPILGDWLDGELRIATDAPGTPICLVQDGCEAVYMSVHYAREMAAALLSAAARVKADDE